MRIGHRRLHSEQTQRSPSSSFDRSRRVTGAADRTPLYMSQPPSPLAPGSRGLVLPPPLTACRARDELPPVEAELDERSDEGDIATLEGEWGRERER